MTLKNNSLFKKQLIFNLKWAALYFETVSDDVYVKFHVRDYTSYKTKLKTLKYDRY